MQLVAPHLAGPQPLHPDLGQLPLPLARVEVAAGEEDRHHGVEDDGDGDSVLVLWRHLDRARGHLDTVTVDTYHT